VPPEPDPELGRRDPPVFPGLAVHEASGTTPQPVPDSTGIVVIGSAALAAKPRKKGRDGKEFGWVETLKKSAPKALIIDEGQDTKEHGANRSQACEQLAAAVIARNGLVLDLTGTAILNRPRELCQQLSILGRIGEFGGPKTFLWRYCLSETSEWGASYNGARNLTELHGRLLAWGIMIRRADDAALGLPPCRGHGDRLAEPGDEGDDGSAGNTAELRGQTHNSYTEGEQPSRPRSTAQGMDMAAARGAQTALRAKPLTSAMSPRSRASPKHGNEQETTQAPDGWRGWRPRWVTLMR
jgi:hypothetical protein